MSQLFTVRKPPISFCSAMASRRGVLGPWPVAMGKAFICAPLGSTFPEPNRGPNRGPPMPKTEKCEFFQR